jgi:hypothetical protein
MHTVVARDLSSAEYPATGPLFSQDELKGKVSNGEGIEEEETSHNRPHIERKYIGIM